MIEQLRWDKATRIAVDMGIEMLSHSPIAKAAGFLRNQAVPLNVALRVLTRPSQRRR